MDVRDTNYADSNSNVAIFDSAMNGMGLSMLVAAALFAVRLLF